MSTWLWIVIGVIAIFFFLFLYLQWLGGRTVRRIQQLVKEKNSEGLETALRDIGEDMIKIRVAKALAEWQDPSTIPALTNWLGQANTYLVRQAIIDALANMPGGRVSGAPPAASIGDLLMASIANIHRETQDNFAALLKQVTPGISDPLSLKDSVAPASNITWDNSEELREASKPASDPATREDGIAKLKALSETHPTSSAPYALLAQALEQNHQRGEAEQLLLGAIDKVHTKSEILDMLGNVSKDEKDHRKATAYYLMAAYAMNPHSTDWGTMVYLSGVYRAIGNEERARECDAAAAAMRGGNRVDLTTETYTAIREAVQQSSILEELANNAWPSICDNIGRLSGKYGKETWTPGPPPAPASAVSEPSRAEVAAMLDDFEGSLDSLLRIAIPTFNVNTASMDEKMKAAALLAQSDSQFRNQFVAVLEGLQNRAASVRSTLEEERESKQESADAPESRQPLKNLEANSAEQPFERRKLEVSWEEFAAKKLAQPMAGSPEICLRCESTAMAESILRLRPSSTSRFLREQPFLTEFTDGTGAVFELESGNDTGVFVDELFKGNYGDQKVMVTNGIVVGASDKKATIDKLGIPQALRFGDVITW